MTPERFARVDSLFNAALDLPAPERHSFLEKECTGDPELLLEVRAMVDADSDPGATIDRAMVAGAEAWALFTARFVMTRRSKKKSRSSCCASVWTRDPCCGGLNRNVKYWRGWNIPISLDCSTAEQRKRDFPIW